MTEQYSQEELNEAYFIQLIYTFQAAAMQQMGKIINPMTGQVEKNMEQAKHSIDMLAMLEVKTSGNLTDRERKILEKSLFELRMNYVDEMKVAEETARSGQEKAQEKAEKEKQAASGEKERKSEETAEKAASGKEGRKTKEGSGRQRPTDASKTDSGGTTSSRSGRSSKGKKRSS
jgi:hypothetical protein